MYYEKCIIFIAPNGTKICKEKFRAQNYWLYVLFNLIVVTFLQKFFLSAFLLPDLKLSHFYLLNTFLVLFAKLT